MKFSKKTVVVTGAANGIGRGIALEYAKNGANVVLADVDSIQGEQFTSELRSQNYEATFIKTDVRLEEELVHLINSTKETYGGIHILINNAGKGLFKSPFDVTVEEWEDIIHTNLRSVFFCSREAAKVMRENNEGGSIINIASTRAFMSEPHSEGYAATKGGIIALTHALAASFGEYHITVNAISPGWIETGNYQNLRAIDHQQHFSKRVGTPSDIARACLYLTEPSNNFVTGTNLMVDGGMTRKMIYEE